jgi:hypothetical protein
MAKVCDLHHAYCPPILVRCHQDARNAPYRLGVPETKECILESLEVAFRNGTGLAVASKPTAVCTGGAAT